MNRLTDNRFSKSNRLLASKQYKSTYGDGGKFRNSLFLLVKSKRKGDQPRIGITISKRNCKLAVSRNRIKRQVREVFRVNKNTLMACDYIIIAQKNVADAQNKVIARQLRKLFYKAGQTN